MSPCLQKRKLLFLPLAALAWFQTCFVTWHTQTRPYISGVLPTELDSAGDGDVLAFSWIPKAWDPVHHRQWCKPRTGRGSAGRQPPSLMYLKIPKTSSSTLSGINIRIARHIGGEVLPDQRACSHTYAHGRGFLDKRQPPFLLWTMLRDPGSRALSEYYHFKVSRNGAATDDELVLPFLSEDRNSTFRLVRVNEKEFDWADALEQFQGSIPDWFLIQRTVMEPYNFIGLVERRDESLAVMKLLWNMSMSNFVAMSTKISGGYDDGRYKDTCFKIQKAPQPLPSSWSSSYISSGFHENNLDWVLYSMVNRTLDKTIESLGVENVNREAEDLQRLQDLVEKECTNRTILPCSANGEHQRQSSSNCHWADSGCGYQCIDEVMQKQGYM